MKAMNPLDLLDSLSIGYDYSKASLDQQSENLQREWEEIAEIAAEIRERNRELENE